MPSMSSYSDTSEFPGPRRLGDNSREHDSQAPQSLPGIILSMPMAAVIRALRARPCCPSFEFDAGVLVALNAGDLT